MYATPTLDAEGSVVSSVMKFVTKQLARQIHEGVQGLKRDAAFATNSVDVVPMLAAMELALPTIPYNSEACAQVVSRTNYTVCDAPESYFFFDQFHPTTAGHKHMADALVGLLGR
ncbi:hypothetical protein SARC_05346 [Sphaeroforma arctica JP610]|uniref:Uncharacterized protein n=1 Tax=Sphaeroforma arctica JP610 TaxID=667725 RepID=A0A0L0FZX7_9EUKA|nr:hypothetical protein SARC_05346 [Sphaeroforma arctica JP610]KNC82375.1 hypothetical protein SARC_05346 [Sphaeroforma arctica JP610]|eukprot:XP_014156277.1 hypothetical protein SARC_05346 [Sphaeroforma arctica JP610]